MENAWTTEFSVVLFPFRLFSCLSFIVHFGKCLLLFCRAHNFGVKLIELHRLGLFVNRSSRSDITIMRTITSHQIYVLSSDHFGWYGKTTIIMRLLLFGAVLSSVWLFAVGNLYKTRVKVAHHPQYTNDIHIFHFCVWLCLCVDRINSTFIQHISATFLCKIDTKCVSSDRHFTRSHIEYISSPINLRYVF